MDFKPPCNDTFVFFFFFVIIYECCFEKYFPGFVRFVLSFIFICFQYYKENCWIFVFIITTEYYNYNSDIKSINQTKRLFRTGLIIVSMQNKLFSLYVY